MLQSGMPGPGEISLSQYTWALWKREAHAALARAKRAAWFAAGIATAAAVWAGIANVEGEWRYSVVIYAPMAGWIVYEPTARVVMRRIFQATGAAMRYRLVPALVPHASDAQLAQLAAHDAVSIGSQRLRAVDTGKEVIVSARPTGYVMDDAAVMGGEGGSSDAGDIGGSAGWGDGGGGFGGGGGGGDGGGG